MSRRSAGPMDKLGLGAPGWRDRGHKDLGLGSLGLRVRNSGLEPRTPEK